MPSLKKTQNVVATALRSEDKPIVACHVSMRGWRRTMEDAFVMETNIRGRDWTEEDDESSKEPTPVIGSRRLSTQRRSTGGNNSRKIYDEVAEAMKQLNCSIKDNDLLLSIFDGHGGSLVSEYASRHLMKELLQIDYFKNYAANKVGLESLDETGEKTESGERSEKSEKSDVGGDCVGGEGGEGGDTEATNGETNGDLTAENQSISRALHEAYLNLDSKLCSSVANDPSPPRQKMYDTMGSTAVSAFITSKTITVASLGDSRAILCRDYNAVSLTKDHKPSNPSETARVINAGGTVQRGRINGNLAVSRSLGDFFYKNDTSRKPEEQMVSPVPDVTVTDIRPGEDQFLIIACDGVWDVVTEQDACYLVSEMLGEGKDLEDVCKKFLDYCMLANSRDNMSVIICVFQAGWECEVGAYKKAPKLEEAMRVKDNLATVNSHVEKHAKANSVNKAASASRRASMQVFEGLKLDDGVIKISTRAATHCDEVLRLSKEVVLGWDEHGVVEHFLRLCELDGYGEHFVEEGVDGKLLMELTQDEMEDDLMMNGLDARFLKMATTFLDRIVSG